MEEGKVSQENKLHDGLSQRQLDIFRAQKTLQAPSTLLEGLETRIARYKNGLTIPLSAEHLQQALHHKQWEVRSMAIERLDMQDLTGAHTVLDQALQDEHRFVRMAALQALAGSKTSTSRSLLAHGLHDSDWQVREVAVQVLGASRNPAALEMIVPALHDENAEVREAAQLALRQHEKRQTISLQVDVPIQSTIQTKEEEKHIMQPNQLSAAVSQASETLSLAQAGASQPGNRQHFLRGKKHMRRSQFLLLVAIVILSIGVLTAAGYNWWNYQMGDPDMYATINQQQTSQGVTIKITRVYVDEGHTIIAYDVPIVNQNTFYTVVGWELTGSFPQKEDALSSSSSITYGNGKISQPDRSVNHRYMVQPQFLVPAGANQLTIHLDITHLNISHPVIGKDVGKVTQLQGNWSFTFTVPFHHTNNPHIPSPIE